MAVSNALKLHPCWDKNRLEKARQAWKAVLGLVPHFPVAENNCGKLRSA